ncbi:MAG: GntR family transcriptional regulator [Kosmotogaceae bacterium]|nr:GntR family transcriptional regulator [Kosmotogaceae bacterium]
MKNEVPMYRVLFKRITQMIKEQELSPGDRLPTERELMDEFGVSRATVVRAMTELENSSVVKRIQGKGTFVSGEKLNLHLPGLTGFSEDLIMSSGQPRTKVVSYEIGSEMRESKYFSEEDRELIYIVRLRLSGEDPIGINYNYVPYIIAKTIGFLPENIDANPSTSLYRLLDEYGYQLDYADQFLEAKAATRTEAKLLNIPPGAPVMSYERVTHTTTGRVVEFVRATIAGNAYRYSIRLYRNGSGNQIGGKFPNLRKKE